MLVTDIDLDEVVDSVWSSMLGLVLERGAQPFDFAGVPSMTGTVQITGCWEGAVILTVPVEHARLVAATMFGMDDAELGDDEVGDALGEMANMVGGNVKGLLAGEAKLSLPTVTSGRDYRVSVPGGEELSRLSYRCEGQPIEVRLVAKPDAG